MTKMDKVLDDLLKQGMIRVSGYGANGEPLYSLSDIWFPERKDKEE